MAANLGNRIRVGLNAPVTLNPAEYESQNDQAVQRDHEDLGILAD
jgi:hypothetical protein